MKYLLVLLVLAVGWHMWRTWQQAHGVARTSYGPLSQNVALTALQELAEEVDRGGGVPSTMRMLN